MGKTICLVTYELAPVNRGGAGVVIASLAEALASAGHEVHLLADMPEKELARYREIVAAKGHRTIFVHQLETLAPVPAGSTTIYGAKSGQFRDAIYALAKRVSFDLVEFFEYAGSAFETLVRRTPHDALAHTEIVVRIHGSLGMIDQVEGNAHVSTDRHAMYRMEEWALRLADTVIAPLRGVGNQYQQIYGFDPARLRVCPPPMEQLLAEIGRPVARDSELNEVVFYGKLQSVKGCETFVDAGLLLTEGRPNLRFVLVGPDTNDAEGHSMRARLDSLIPERWRGRFRFVSHIHRSELGALVSRAVCAVVPSKAESFCLAAHELHRVGAPLVLSDVPAFRDAFTAEQSCLFFDGTATNLAVQIERLARHPDLARKLGDSGNDMHYPDLATMYELDKPALNEMSHAAAFASREVGSLGFWGVEHSRRHNRLTELERAIEGGSASAAWRFAKSVVPDSVRQPMRQMVNRIFPKS